jgi:hypothetical protein
MSQSLPSHSPEHWPEKNQSTWQLVGVWRVFFFLPFLVTSLFLPVLLFLHLFFRWIFFLHNGKLWLPNQQCLWDWSNRWWLMGLDTVFRTCLHLGSSATQTHTTRITTSTPSPRSHAGMPLRRLMKPNVCEPAISWWNMPAQDDPALGER